MATSDTYQALREGAGVLDRVDRGRLFLSGDDRRAYLQGILTNDIAALGPGTGCYAAYLTPQGRMIADLRVFEMGDRIMVDLDATLAAAVADRWSMFVITEDVTVEDVSAATAQIGIYGPTAATVLRQALEAGHAADESVPGAGTLEAMPLYGNARWDFGGEPVQERLAKEREHLQPLPSSRLPEYTKWTPKVRMWSTIQVNKRTYSVPSRLIGHCVEARQYPDVIEVLYKGRIVESMPRLRGKREARIDYRHVIWSLAKKPSAFARYRYREELFPSLVFRRAYDALREQRGERADVEYVRILHLAASPGEGEGGPQGGRKGDGGRKKGPQGGRRQKR
jgi:hypothetical protein